jgi:hypothetical protein
VAEAAIGKEPQEDDQYAELEQRDGGIARCRGFRHRWVLEAPDHSNEHNRRRRQ